MNKLIAFILINASIILPITAMEENKPPLNEKNENLGDLTQGALNYLDENFDEQKSNPEFILNILALCGYIENVPTDYKLSCPQKDNLDQVIQYLRRKYTISNKKLRTKIKLDLKGGMKKYDFPGLLELVFPTDSDEKYAESDNTFAKIFPNQKYASFKDMCIFCNNSNKGIAHQKDDLLSLENDQETKNNKIVDLKKLIKQYKEEAKQLNKSYEEKLNILKAFFVLTKIYEGETSEMVNKVSNQLKSEEKKVQELKQTYNTYAKIRVKTPSQIAEIQELNTQIQEQEKYIQQLNNLNDKMSRRRNGETWDVLTKINPWSTDKNQ